MVNNNGQVFKVELIGTSGVWLVFADNEAEARNGVAVSEVSHRTANTTTGATQYMDDRFENAKKSTCVVITSNITINEFGYAVFEDGGVSYTLVKNIAQRVRLL